jgi:hypothetical protein
MKITIITIGICSGVLAYFFQRNESYYIIYELASLIPLTGGSIMHHIDNKFKDRP